MEWAQVHKYIHHTIFKRIYKITERRIKRILVYSQHDVGSLTSKNPEAIKEEEIDLNK